MHTVKQIVCIIRRFSVTDLARESGVSRRTIYALMSGENTNPLADTVAKLERGVVTLAKRKPRRKTDNKQTRSRDKRRASVAGGKA